jgi:hypothetical protein
LLRRVFDDDECASLVSTALWWCGFGGPEAFKRLVKVALRMAERTGQSLPKQCPDWGELKAGYRLLSHSKIEPIALNQPHRLLAVQDDADLAGRCGWECHSTLAVLPAGQLLGLLDQRFFERVEQPEGETRRERDLRWRESLVWAEAVEAIGPGMPDCRVITWPTGRPIISS